ncbi:MAG: DNA primase [Treponema sp.]|jgi:DNA primase|nr:DNA primase [Treponema sp.]
MSRIARSTIQELNERLDAVGVVGDYVRLEKKGGRWWGLCPFHNEKTPSFTVDPERKMYHCFGCGQGGGIINFVMEMDKLSFPEAVETLARRAGIEIVRENGDFEQRDPEENDRKEEMAELFRRVSVTFHYFLTEKDEGSLAKQYIISRGIDQGMIERFRLGYAPADRNWLFNFLSKKGYSPQFLAGTGLFSERYPQSSFFSHRLMFPIADRQGRTVAFGGRIIEGEGPKYLNSRESELYKKGQTLFAVDLALPEIRKTKEVYLAEGYMDVIALHQAGISNAVAPLGTAFTDDQAKLLRRWAEKAYLVFDSDQAGQNAAIKGILTCRRNGLSCAVVVPGGAEKGGPEAEFKDPADILRYQGPEALQNRMKCFIIDFNYFVSRSRSLYDISAVEGKAKAVAFLFPYFDTLDSDVSRDSCIGAVAAALGADKTAILNDYNRRRSGEKASPQVVRVEKPVWANDELYLLSIVLVNFRLYPNFRKAISIDEVEDPAAKELFIAMEESYINEEGGVDDLMARISSPALRRYVAEKGTSKEFLNDPEQLVKDGIKRIQQKKLRRRLSEIVAELHSLESPAGNDGFPGERAPGAGFRPDLRIEELLVEKMHIDTELRRL